MTSDHLLAALAGLGTGLSLIVAIGAQNAFVLRQGLRGEHVGLVVAACALSDLVLIAAGVAGAGALIVRSPELLSVVRIGGAAFLLTYAALALRRALGSAEAGLVVEGADEPTDPTHAVLGAGAAALAGGAGPSSAVRMVPTAGRWAPVLVTMLALTWLNPHVYLDTVVLLGSIAGSHGAERWWFAAGAGLGSVVWFSALGYGAALLRPVFARPAAWRVLDALIALVMTAIAASLLLSA